MALSTSLNHSIVFMRMIGRIIRYHIKVPIDNQLLYNFSEMYNRTLFDSIKHSINQSHVSVNR